MSEQRTFDQSLQGDLEASKELLRIAKRKDDIDLIWSVWGHLWYHHPEHQHLAAREALERPLPAELGGDDGTWAQAVARRQRISQAKAARKTPILTSKEWDEEINRNTDIAHLSEEEAAARRREIRAMVKQIRFMSTYGCSRTVLERRLKKQFLESRHKCLSWLVYGTAQVTNDAELALAVLKRFGTTGWVRRVEKVCNSLEANGRLPSDFMMLIEMPSSITGRFQSQSPNPSRPPETFWNLPQAYASEETAMTMSLLKGRDSDPEDDDEPDPAVVNAVHDEVFFDIDFAEIEARVIAQNPEILEDLNLDVEIGPTFGADPGS